MYTGRHYEEELCSIEDFAEYERACVNEKRLFMERYRLLPKYER